MKICELEVGKSCNITLVVKSATPRETRAKKPYLVLELYDGVDTVTGNYWDWVSGNIPEVNSILDVSATVTEWQGKKQLTISSLRNNTTRHLAEFMPSNGMDIGKVYNAAYELAGTVKDDMLRNLLLSALEALQNSWLTVPGAKGVHHAYIGGTLVHSYSVAKIAKAIAEQIPEANTDLCIVGGMLHDVGKLFTYKMNGIAIDRTDDGNLYEHIFMGAEFIGNFADSVVDTDNYLNMKKLQLLRHIILSHHGCLEYGSPVTPQCIEAFIVNHADGIDASVEQIRTAARKVPDNLKWTERIYTLGNCAQLTPNYVSASMADYSEGGVMQG
jgi:3'-5' exoribonuclease